MLFSFTPEQSILAGELLIDRPFATVAAYKFDSLTNNKPKNIWQHLGNIAFPGWNTAFKLRELNNQTDPLSFIGAALVPRRFCAYQLTKMQYGNISAGDFIEFVFLGGLSMFTVVSRLAREEKKLGYVQLFSHNPDLPYWGVKKEPTCNLPHQQVSAKPLSNIPVSNKPMYQTSYSNQVNLNNGNRSMAYHPQNPYQRQSLLTV